MCQTSTAALFVSGRSDYMRLLGKRVSLKTNDLRCDKVIGHCLDRGISGPATLVHCQKGQ